MAKARQSLTRLGFLVPMTPFIKTTILILFGSFIGYFSAHYVISGNFGALTTYNNGWTLWNKAGQPDADPYTKAHFALKRELPLSGFEEMIFSTNLDSTGGPLTSNCRYQIEGNVISSRSWGLSVVARSGGRSSPDAIRKSFNTDNVIRQGKGNFKVTLSAPARPGNWLPIPDNSSEIKLVLVLFNPDQETIEDPSSAALPIIQLEACG